jgi:hypothetical protein
MKIPELKRLLLAYRGDPDVQCQAAETWVKLNPAASRVRVGLWEALHRVSASEPTFDRYIRRIDQHLHQAEHRPGGNRWEKPDVTQALLKALCDAAAVKAGALPPTVQAGLDGLDPADCDSVIQLWKRDRARDFLRAIILTIKTGQAQRGSGAETI